MARTTIHDENGTAVGHLRDLDGGQVGYDRHHRLIGIYEAATDTTTDRDDNIVGMGNLLVAMIKRAR